jgi:hypothetical protein
MITRDILTENLLKYSEYCRQCDEFEKQISATYILMDEIMDHFSYEEREFYLDPKNVDLF